MLAERLLSAVESLRCSLGVQKRSITMKTNSNRFMHDSSFRGLKRLLVFSGLASFYSTGARR
jgi:hypothetical protein